MANIDLDTPELCDVTARQGDTITYTITTDRQIQNGDRYFMSLRRRNATTNDVNVSSDNTGLDVGGFESFFDEEEFDQYDYDGASTIEVVANSADATSTDLTITMPIPITQRLTGRYEYDLEVLTITNTVTTLFTGEFNFNSDITKTNLFT